ncbi:hypothetical protein ON010_g11645 [Phytophthora cinnamomi]|nr:hypothetical protein ON010_g11645 [Phytophthora cinnamomi]
MATDSCPPQTAETLHDLLDQLQSQALATASRPKYAATWKRWTAWCLSDTTSGCRQKSNNTLSKLHCSPSTDGSHNKGPQHSGGRLSSLPGQQTDQACAGTTRTLHRSGSSWLCPVLALSELVEISRRFESNAGLCSTSPGNILTANTLGNAIKSAATAIGADPTRFGTHSMRTWWGNGNVRGRYRQAHDKALRAMVLRCVRSVYKNERHTLQIPGSANDGGRKVSC